MAQATTGCAAGPRRAVLALGVALLAGCASAPPGPPMPAPPPPAAEAARLQAAPPGMTRLYVLRPGISDAGKADSPTVLVDGEPLAELPHRGFLSVALAPGPHELSLRPGRYDARGWASAVRFRARASDILFLAVLRERDDSGGAPGSAPPQLATRPETGVRTGGVSYAFMHQSDAVALLPSLQFVRPLRERVGAVP